MSYKVNTLGVMIDMSRNSVMNVESLKKYMELLKKAVDKKVAYVPGTHFYADGGHNHTFRLNFSMPTVDQIKQGMAALNEVFSK